MMSGHLSFAEGASATRPAGTRPASPVDPSAILGAVREDIRQTLRMAWIDPALEALSPYPTFLTAGWSVVRPNVGKSFLVLARALRSEAAEIAAEAGLADVRQALGQTLSEEEVRRVEEAARAAHLAAAKLQIVIHALHRAARREKILGTGREEPPIRRGVPEWQRWLATQPIPEPAAPVLDEAAGVLRAPAPPAPIRLLARWPVAAEAVWAELKRSGAGEGWKAATVRLRRMVLAGVQTFPHPMHLQWTALRSRGLSEERRNELVEILAGFDAAMPAQTLACAFAWKALGSLDMGVEG